MAAAGEPTPGANLSFQIQAVCAMPPAVPHFDMCQSEQTHLLGLFNQNKLVFWVCSMLRLPPSSALPSAAMLLCYLLFLLRPATQSRRLCRCVNGKLGDDLLCWPPMTCWALTELVQFESVCFMPSAANMDTSLQDMHMETRQPTQKRPSSFLQYWSWWCAQPSGHSCTSCRSALSTWRCSGS